MAKLLSTLALIIAASATPVVIPASKFDAIGTRQILDRTSLTENEFSSILGGCKDVIFVWARGSTELGNMVRSSAGNTSLNLTLFLRAPLLVSRLVMSFAVNTVET